jgi:deoxyhypusine synthase
MIYFHSFRNPGLIVDIVRDIRALNELSRKSKKAGMIILGGGVCKHQIANAMLIVSFTLEHYSKSYLPSEMEPITLYTSSVFKDKSIEP